MKLSPDLREFIELLNSKEVKYVIVGGHAVVFHGYPRLTVDVDFFVECSAENARRLEEVMHDFGFSSLGLTAKDFLEPGQVVQLGRAPNRIDLLTSLSGVTFEEAWQTKVAAKFGDLSVFILGRESLVKNKKATGRPQDLADLDNIAGCP